MKYLGLMAVMASALCAAQYQACIIFTQTGQSMCHEPESKQSAATRALIYNATSQGQVVAWTRKAPKGSNKSKPQEGQPSQGPVIIIPGQPDDAPDGAQPLQQGKPKSEAHRVSGE